MICSKNCNKRHHSDDDMLALLKRIKKKNLHFSRLNYKNIKEQQRKIKNASHFTQNLFTECGNKIKLTNERKEEMDKKEDFLFSFCK